MPTDPGHHQPIDPALHAKLHRWVAASLITAAEAEAIEDFESRSAPIAARRVPLVTEALAYLGAALAAAAAAVLLGDRWQELAPTVHVAAVGSGAAIALAGGWALRRSEEPAFARTTSVLWFAGTGLVAWLAGLIAGEVLEHGGRVPLLAAAAAATVCGAILFALRRRALQQIALFAGLVALVATAFGEPPSSPTAVWVVGAVWVAAATLGVLRPDRPAAAAGALVALYAPAPLSAAGEGWGLWLGLGTAAALLAMSVWRREPILLGLGGVGLFGYLVAVLADAFGGTAGMPIALLLAGAIVLALALGYARRSGRVATRTAPRSPS